MPGREDEAELGVELTPSGSHASRSQFVYNVKTNRYSRHRAALLPDGVWGYRQSMQGKEFSDMIGFNHAIISCVAKAQPIARCNTCPGDAMRCDVSE